MSPERPSTGRTALFLALSLLLASTPAAFADDRELLRGSVSEPYVFIILDTSGSMHWSPKCTQDQFNNNECDFLCPTGDCFVPLNGDDPSSKFYQAKEALYEVIKDIDNVQFGFATYNQDNAFMESKHYLYRARENGPNIVTGFPFPSAGSEDVLGRTWSCTSGTQEGCNPDNPADSGDSWEMTRIRRLPKGGISFNENVTVYIRHGGNRYRVIYAPVSGSLGSSVRFNIDIDRCTNTACSNRVNVDNRDVNFDYVNQFGSWDNGDNRANPRLGYFNQGEAADPNAGNTCAGWDPNATATGTPPGTFPSETLAADGTYNIRYPTKTDPAGRGAFFTIGDVIPLDWSNNHQEDILKRLAPNTITNPNATPDFRSAWYFRDTRQGAETFLRLKDDTTTYSGGTGVGLRPLIASGSTPLGNSVKSFRSWWAGCTGATCPAGGWEKEAAARDAQFACRKKFLLVLTDGDESCAPPNGSGADPCPWTKTLFEQEGIKTFVVGFGVEDVEGNKLECMAAEGGSGEPIYPQNKQELINALTDIFGQIREEASAFASAAVPSVQAEVADRIFLSSFTPLNGEAIWDGHLEAYLKPLPLTEDGKPDRERACPPVGSSNRGSCHLWDAGEVIVGQAPLMDDLNSASSLSPSILKLGLNPDERRVFYGKTPPTNGIHQDLALLAPPQTAASTSDPNWLDLWNALKIPSTIPVLAKLRTENIIKQTLAVKHSEIEKADGSRDPIDYVLGDIFHSDPAIIDRPSDFGFYSSNLFALPNTASCTNNPGYRCFADRHVRRRKMVVVGSNDGQLHFFDAGIWDPDTGKFTDGTGTELFSYIPRLGMPIIRDLAEDGRQIYGIDSTPRLDDVFLDPKHNGTPTASEREWRTLVIGGFREGGEIDADGGQVTDFISGYYALDVTQPDQLRTDKSPIDERIVPSCMTTNNQTVSGCGTLPFPAVLWEFTDSLPGGDYRFDEDDNNEPDLGQTWSVPTVGRIKVMVGATETYKFVAIFGGGFDPANKSAPRRGNWLYMVDIETGQAIYKRQLQGAATADPAVLDRDLDGFLDTIYIGTTAGFLYKVDISLPATLQAATIVPGLTVPARSGLPALTTNTTVQRIVGWNPFQIFTTGGKPIFFAPTAFFVSKLSRFALAFGTGDRENLWSETGVHGRFFLIIDDNYAAGNPILPLDETDFQGIDYNSGDSAAGSDFVFNPPIGHQRGWYIRLPADERVITQAFGLSGVVIFSSYQPKLEIDPDSDGAICARGGDSSIFVVYANNANGIMTEADPDAPPPPPNTPKKKTRFRTVPEFVTNPYVEQGATKNPGNNENPDDDDAVENSEQLREAQREIMETLKQFFPPETKFANYWISVSGIRSDTGYERYATIPIGIIQRNWKEHP